MHIATLNQIKIEEASFVVLDFETVTPKGRPPEPIELAAMRINPGLQVDHEFKFDKLIKPPDGAPITSFDTVQTGIRWNDVRDKPPTSVALREFDVLLQEREYLLVAQNARYEAAIINRFPDECQHIVKMPFIDTIALAKYLVLGMPNYKLNSLARHFSVTIPINRHRALPDVEIALQIFLKLLEIGQKTKRIHRVIDLRHVAEIKKYRSKKATQRSLFDYNHTNST